MYNKYMYKMNFFMYILAINIFIIWTVTYGKVSQDRKKLNFFSKRGLNTICCDGTSIECDVDGNIKVKNLIIE